MAAIAGGAGVDPLLLEKQLPVKGVSLRGMIMRTRHSWQAKRGEYDFSHEVKEAMSGCLACKACSTQCPIKIDVPGFRSRFYSCTIRAICGPPVIIWWQR